MSNVINSTSDAASNCVDLPPELMAENLVVIYLFFRQWTGTVSMSRADYSVGSDGSLPPEAVAANYGQKRVIDPVHLRTFDAIKKRADTLLADAGLPFCKGTVVPIEKAPEVVAALNELAVEYNQKRDQFVTEIPRRFQEWMQKNPEFSGRIPAPCPEDIANRINADFSVFRFQPLAPEIDATGSLTRSVNGLFGEVIRDVSKRSFQLFRRSVSGKSADDLSQRTLSGLKLLKTKLESLQFVNSGVRPIGELVARVLSIMPNKGRFSTEQFNALHAALGLLSNESLLLEVARGKLTLDEHFSRNLVGIALPAVDRSLFEAASVPVQKTSATPADPTPEKEEECAPAVAPTETADAEEAEAPAEALPKAEAPKTPEAPEHPAVEAESRVEAAPEASFSADGSTASETESATPSTATADSRGAAPKPQADSKDEAGDFDALLASFFDDDSRGAADGTHQEDDPETEASEAENVPPAPKAIRLSAF